MHIGLSGSFMKGMIKESQIPNEEKKTYLGNDMGEKPTQELALGRINDTNIHKQAPPLERYWRKKDT